MAQCSIIQRITVLVTCASIMAILLASPSSYAGPPSQPLVLDGLSDQGGLTQAPDGTIYGATQSGGRTPCAADWGYVSGRYSGCGTIFQIHPDGRANTLYYFHGGQDGVYPQGLGLLPGGGLIGMSWVLGNPHYLAKVFRLSATGAITILGEVESPRDHGDLAWDGHEFFGIANDDKFPFYTLDPKGKLDLLAIPAAILAQCGVPIALGDGDEDISYGPSLGPDGAVYATTKNCVLRLAARSEEIRVVARSTRFDFVNAPAFDAAGHMYAAAWLIGTNDHTPMDREDEGIVRIDRSVRVEVLATLPPPDPEADANYITGFVMGRHSILYGIAYLGGRFGAGMLFSVDMVGKLVDLHDFCGASWTGDPRDRPAGCDVMGQAPFANLMTARDGAIWGASDYGVFEYQPGKESFTYVIRFSGR